MDGDPNIVGNKLNYIDFKKYKLTAVVEEVNKFIQKGNIDDNNEWNYKYKITFKNEQEEYLNCIFISCENGSKTWVSVIIKYKNYLKENYFILVSIISIL